MRINSIDIYNFRNYERAFIEFSDKMNIFIGNNGEGKTNILESIYVLAITKSHRSYIDKNLINNSKDIMKLSSNVFYANNNNKLELVMNNKGKRVSINNLVYKKISDYISNLVVVLFSPDDLDLIKGSPTTRRKFLNIEIGQLDNKYLYYLNDYNNLLKQRNEYLKSITINTVDTTYLDIIDEKLSEKALYVYKYRYEFIKDINRFIKNVFSDLSNSYFEIKYINNFDNIDFDFNIKEKFLKKLKSNLKRDILTGGTSVGPQRDDFEFFLDKKNVRDYGSQGQQRLCVLTLKFAEVELLCEKRGEYPILLLDDIFSELDISKRNSIIKYLDKGVQVFITSTDLNDIDKTLLSNSKIFNIENGNIV